MFAKTLEGYQSLGLLGKENGYVVPANQLQSDAAEKVKAQMYPWWLYHRGNCPWKCWSNQISWYQYDIEYVQVALVFWEVICIPESESESELLTGDTSTDMYSLNKEKGLQRHIVLMSDCLQ